MNHAIAIARREIAERSFVFLAAIALAVVACLMPFVPGVHQSPGEVIAVAAVVCAIGVGLGMSIMLGATIVGRELADRRLSFYFAKPVSAPAIWFGKLIACAILVVGGFAITVLPALLAGRAQLVRTFGDRSTFIMPLAIMTVVAFFAAHVVSTVVRSRSPWIAVDFAAFLGLAFVVWMIVQPLRNAMDMLALVAELFGWLALGAVLVAGARQLQNGRTDRQQSHRSLTMSLWPALAIAVAICASIVLWVVSATPSDLVEPHEIGTGGNSEAIIGGPAAHRRDYMAAFVIDMKTGEFARLSSATLQGGFVADGRKILLIRPVVSAQKLGEIIIRDAAVKGSSKATGLLIDPSSYPIATSPDANRIAYVSQGVLSVYDIPSKASLGSVRVGKVRTMWFASSDVVRVYSVTDGTRDIAPKVLDIREYDVRARRFAQTGSYRTNGQFLFFTASADGSRLFARSDDNPIVVLDGRTGAPLTTVAGAFARSLPDGRIVTTQPREIRIYDQGGVVLRKIPVESPRFGLRIASANRALVTMRVADAKGAWLLETIDLDNGSVLAKTSDLQPAETTWWFGDSRSASMPVPDALFIDHEHNLVHWNLVTNQRNVIARRNAS